MQSRVSGMIIAGELRNSQGTKVQILGAHAQEGYGTCELPCCLCTCTCAATNFGPLAHHRCISSYLKD